MAIEKSQMFKIRIRVLQDLEQIFPRHTHPDINKSIKDLIRNLEADELEEQGEKARADIHRRLIPEW